MANRHQLAMIDCQLAGISGDMLLGALLDLGADSNKVVYAIESIETQAKECENLRVGIRTVKRRGFRAKKVDVEAARATEMKGIELTELVEQCINGLKLSGKARNFASNSIRTLVNAEAKVHGEHPDEVHLHEAGQVDTPAEIVGSAVALEDLDFFNMKVYSTPVAVGGGLLRFSHGTVSSPSLATIEILQSRGFPMVGGPVESELATPTGVSLLVNLVDEVTRFYPPIKPMATGYGAGMKDFAEMPNILRVTLGEPLDHDLVRDEISVLETNMDDATGEIIGHAIDKLLRVGAKDISVIPMFTKKNRPGHILKVIVDKEDVERLSRILIEETGTLGVRTYPCERRILARESIPVEVVIGDLRRTVEVKVARDSKGEIIQIKPEYDDAKRVAEETKKPLREILQLIQERARSILLTG